MCALLLLHKYIYEFLWFFLKCVLKRLRWSRGSVLAFSTQDCGFKPREKILSTPSF